MKRTLILSALALSTLAGVASAATPADQAILQRYAPNVEVATLTDAQVSNLLNIVASGDSASDKRTLIQNFVN
ncbi:hypothetical protein P775_16385 [Puniceibacterium antarcticum]|uniref:Uncharacterized protein n=1 Tax=Puniceibacterium antarcticum TaxID=1206336 RepID=A0A2G8RDB3_9RHOB|nr:hypothetical protein [Puniceibacterium antarcticum]PIL19088.1 hypothetical protein P775_16385 [Puniceibacterium antarcticum]